MPTDEQIDVASLRVREPILFYRHVDLYADDFGDNGDVALWVKVRVMPSSIFVLQRLFVHVTGVSRRGWLWCASATEP